MLFISYWELNPDLDPTAIGEVAQELMSKKIYPVAGIKDIVFHVSPSDYWGISLTEAESEEALARSTNIWRIAKPGMIKLVKTSPGIEVAKALPILAKLKKDIKG
jgi:hypothetical protein